MASVSFRDILGAPQLCGSYNTVKSGIPDVFGPEFYVADQEVSGNKGSYFQSPGQRQTAKTTAYGSASTSTQSKSETEVPIILSHTCENMVIPANELLGLIRDDSSGSNLLIDERGVQKVSKRVKDAVMRVRNLKVAMVTQLFTLGANYFDATGNLLPSSAGAKTTQASQIAAANIGNLTSVLSGATVWSNTAADIEDDLVHLDQLAMDNTGYELSRAFYGRNIPKYMSTNPKMASFLARNAGVNDLYIKKGRITELGNLTWSPGYRSSFRSSTWANGVETETTNRIIGDDQIIFTPEPNPEWFAWVNGSVMVPTTVEIKSDMLSALGTVREQHGDFMYALVTVDPVAIKLVYGTTGLPTVRVPGAVFTVNVAN